MKYLLKVCQGKKKKTPDSLLQQGRLGRLSVRRMSAGGICGDTTKHAALECNLFCITLVSTDTPLWQNKILQDRVKRHSRGNLCISLSAISSNPEGGRRRKPSLSVVFLLAVPSSQVLCPAECREASHLIEQVNNKPRQTSQWMYTEGSIRLTRKAKTGKQPEAVDGWHVTLRSLNKGSVWNQKPKKTLLNA